MKQCARIEKLLSEYISGELSQSLSSRVESHLGTCPACRQALSETEAVIGSLRNDAQPEPDPAFWHYYRATLRERYAASLSDARRPRVDLSWLRTPRFAYALAGAALCIMAVAVGNRLYGPGGATAPGPEPIAAISNVDEWTWSDSLQLASLSEEEIMALETLTIDLEDPSALDPALGPSGGLSEEIATLEADEVDQLYDSLLDYYPEVDHRPSRSTDGRDYGTIRSSERRLA